MPGGFDIGGMFATLEVDSKPFDKTLDQAGGKAEGLKGKLGTIGKGMTLGVGIGAIGLLSSGLDMAVGKLNEAHEAFLEDQASSAAFAGALERNVTGWNGNTAAVDAYINKQIDRGISDDAVRESLGLLVGRTHDLSEAQDINSMAIDLARAKNIDLDTATKALLKAYDGNGAALKKLGIDVTGLTTSTELFAAVQQNAGGAADAWAQTNEGKLAISNNKVGESMEKVGAIIDTASQILVPALAGAFIGLTDTLADVWDATEPLRNTLAPILQRVFGAIGTVIGIVFDQVQSVIRVIQNIIKLAQDAVEAVGNIPGVELVGDIAGNAAGAVGNVAGAIGGLVPKFASGTPGAPGGLARINELGPELAGIPGGAGILSASQTRAALDGAGGGSSVTIGSVSIVANGVDNPDQLARDTLQALRRELTRQGMSLA